MKKINSRLFGFAWFILALLLISAMVMVSYFLTAAIYRLMHLNPPALLVQIVNTLLGLSFTVAAIGLTGKVARSRGWIPELNVFRPIIEALEQIAKGDFSIRLDDQYRDNQIVNELAHSVNKMALELDQMENMRQEFISNVSHEIQSPLTSIRGFAQALEDDRLAVEERHHYLEIIQNESTRLSRITEDLLKLATIDSDHARFEPKPYRLDKQIRSLILVCEPQWSGKRIEMEVALEEVVISADEDLLSQVWINLIYNSLKFTPPGGKICIKLKQKNDGVEFKIADTGIGISEADQERVFERFFKADQSRTYSNAGSGLGLSIAKKIVDLHQGSMALESRLGEGTTFTVFLPGKVKQ